MQEGELVKFIGQDARPFEFPVLEGVQGPAQVHDHEQFHELVHVHLLSGNDEDTAGAVDFTGAHKAEVQVQHQDDQDAEAHRKAEHGQLLVPFHAAEVVKGEDEDKAHRHHLELVHHDAHAVAPRVVCQARGAGEHRNHGDEHEEQGNQEDYLVSGEAVHETGQVSKERVLGLSFFFGYHIQVYRLRTAALNCSPRSS